MKKSLTVRASAVVMVLMVIFFMILPDLVNAEGEKQQEQQTVEAEAPTAEESTPETPAPEEPTPETPAPEEPTPETPAPEEPAPETPAPEEPAPETPAPEESVSEEQPEENPQEPVSTETEADTASGNEQESGSADTAAAGTNSTETAADAVPGNGQESGSTEMAADLTQPDAAQMPSAADETAAETETELMDPEWDVITKTVALADSDTMNLEVSDDIGDFVVEGTTITGYKGPGGHVVIPEGITAIADNVFFNNKSITGVTFPGSLQVIGGSAFNGCSNLGAVSIPGSVTTVGASAFANCTGLASLGLSASTGTVSQGEFYNCSSLVEVIVPEGISSISSQAFGSCANLSSIALPASLASMDMSAFSGDVNLTNIAVNGGGAYSSYDGCIYNAGGSQLLFCPAGKSAVTFASGVSQVASGAFSGCNYLTSVRIPSSVSNIAADAFAGSAIASVTIPAETTSIGDQTSWTPDVVYGYRGSTAESWADNNKYIFESLDGTYDDSDDPNDDNNDEEDDDSDESGSGEDSDDPVESNSGTNTTTVTAAGPGTGSGASAVISQNGNSHVKDATPKTGVEDYGMYFLFGAILLVGIGSLVYSRKLKFEN